MFKYQGVTTVDGIEGIWTQLCDTYDEALEQAETQIIDTCGSKTERCQTFLDALKIKKVKVSK